MRKPVSFGFTLAEVLITLGIIGVVAAMTIPALLNKYYEKRTVSQLIATQSIMAQAFKMAEEEYGDMESWITNQDADVAIAQNLKPFLKLAVDCGETDTNNLCVPNVKYLEKNGAQRLSYTNKGYKVKLLNGSSVFWLYMTSEKLLHLYFDTNGRHSPNTWGKDLFMFEYSNNSLRPMGAPDSVHTYDTECKTKTSSGVGCAYYVLTQKNMNYLH